MDESAPTDGLTKADRVSTPGPVENEERNRMLIKRILYVFFVLGAAFFAYQFGVERGRSDSPTVDGSALIRPGEALFVNSESRDKTIDFSLYWRVWNILKDKYVDRSNLDARKLFYGSIKGMLAATGDPYTTFFDPEEQKSFNEDMSGKFEGIGAEMGMRDGVLTVIAPLDASPAEKAGLRPNDKILKVDGEKTTNLSLEEAVGMIRGPKGTEVSLNIFSEGGQEARDVTVVRDIINVKSVRTDFRDDGTAIIRVSKFGDTTEKEFRNAAETVAGKNPTGIVLDLRSNPGGLLDAAVAMGSLMIPSGRPVVWEEDAKGNRTAERTSGGDILSKIPTVVLIDEGSASASEILAGALREDRDNVELVGKKSYGKGSVQELVPLGTSMSVKVTIARWLTPDGNQINDKGIAPDTEVSITIDDIKAGRDPQMDKALEVLTGRLHR